MKHADTSGSAEQVKCGAVWHLNGLYAVNAHTDERVYVRELLDIGAYEFNFSKLSNGQRLAIISSIGESEIFRLMKEMSIEKGREYREENFKIDIALLLKLADPDLNLRILIGMPANSGAGTAVL